MRLTRAERWIISNQLRILASYFPEEKEILEYQREAIEHGFEREYDSIIPFIESDTLSAAGCDEVVEILEMYWQMGRACRKQSEAGMEIDVRFPGWDGDSEYKQRSYARYYCKQGDRFADMGDSVFQNARRPMLPSYRVMLDEWRDHSRKYSLSFEDVLDLLNLGSRVLRPQALVTPPGSADE